MVQSVETVQQTIVDITTPAPEPEPEPQKPEKKPVIQAYGKVLGSYTTSYNPRQKNRSTNIRLSAGAINGTILQPGDTFDFNKVVGKRTAKNGYQVAAVYSNGGVVDGIGGGICQVSSTLYNAALLSNMQITSRTNHGLRVSYLPAGRDATVSWGGPEFRFKNSNTYPVKVTAGYDSAKGRLTVQVMGPDNATTPDTRIQVTKSKKSYVTKRYFKGKVNYTAYSTYKN